MTAVIAPLPDPDNNFRCPELLGSFHQEKNIGLKTSVTTTVLTTILKANAPDIETVAAATPFQDMDSVVNDDSTGVISGDVLYSCIHSIPLP